MYSTSNESSISDHNEHDKDLTWSLSSPPFQIATSMQKLFVWHSKHLIWPARANSLVGRQQIHGCQYCLRKTSEVDYNSLARSSKQKCPESQRRNISPKSLEFCRVFLLSIWMKMGSSAMLAVRSKTKTDWQKKTKLILNCDLILGSLATHASMLIERQ